MRTIVFPTDFSEAADHALPIAAQLQFNGEMSHPVGIGRKVGSERDCFHC